VGTWGISGIASRSIGASRSKKHCLAKYSRDLRAEAGRHRVFMNNQAAARFAHRI